MNNPLLYVAVACFAGAGLLGLFLLSYVLRDIPTPKGLVFIHGPLAALGIVSLLVAWAISAQGPLLSLGLFIAAALGGFFLLYRDLARGRVPKSIALVHGSLALGALVLLLQFLFSHSA